MQTQDMIAANEFCIHHHIDISFIQALHDSGLITIMISEEKIFIPGDQLYYLEKFARLYYEMDINVEGIETVNYLLQRMENMQQEINRLTNKLKLFEKEY